MPLPRHRHKSRRSRRIAILDRVDDTAGFVSRFRHAARRLIQDHVEHNPTLVRAQVLQRRSHEAPDRRTCPVAANDITRGNLREFSGCEILVANPNVIAEFIERECLAAQSHVNRGKARDALAQYRFEFRLIETVGVVPALRADAAAADQQQQLAVGADMANVTTDRKQWQQLRRQAHGLDKPHALAVECHRPRQMVN